MEKAFLQHRHRGDVLRGKDPPRSPCGLLGAGLTFPALNSFRLPERGAYFGRATSPARQALRLRAEAPSTRRHPRHRGPRRAVQSTKVSPKPSTVTGSGFLCRPYLLQPPAEAASGGRLHPLFPGAFAGAPSPRPGAGLGWVFLFVPLSGAPPTFIFKPFIRDYS